MVVSLDCLKDIFVCFPGNSVKGWTLLNGSGVDQEVSLPKVFFKKSVEAVSVDFFLL